MKHHTETIHEDKEIGQKIIKIIQEVNCHNCTNPCEKYGDKCKYGFPKYPLKTTLVIDKNEVLSEVEDSDKEDKPNYRKILSDVEDLSNDEEQVKDIMRKITSNVKPQTSPRSN